MTVFECHMGAISLLSVVKLVLLARLTALVS